MEYLLKASAVIIVFYLCFNIFLKKETFFQHNRWFLLIGLVIALVFPLIVIPVYIPIESITISDTSNILHQNTKGISQVTSTEPSFQWTSLIPIVYSIGLCLLLIQFIFQFGSLILLLIKNPKNKEGIYTYVIVENKISPFSFFKWIVYNPENYNTDELQLIITHEKVHANQMHSVDILFTQLACAVFWFNPLVWLYRKEVRQNLEHIADFKTQTQAENEKQYQHLLLKTSVANHKISLSNNFYNSSIKKRIVMLKKSRSNRNKQWKYLLILPLLCGLLMSMNTEKVYVETKESTVTSNKEAIEFVVNKNTTDKELQSMTATVEDKGGTLIFSQIQRNNKNELTHIFVKLYNRSYGGGDSKNTIESFIIYKELFGDRGGYVGRINGATLHFDKIKGEVKNNPEIDALQKRAHNAIIKAGIQTEEELKDYKKKFTETKSNKKVKTFKPVKTVKKNILNANSKNIAIITPKLSQKKPKSESDISITVINKNTTNAELDNIKDRLKKEGLTAKFKGIKRNKSGEITAIKIDVKSKSSNASYNVNSDEAIDTIKIVYDEEKNSISIGNGHSSHSTNSFVYETKGSKHKIHKSGNGSHVYVISEDEHEHDDEHEHEEHNENVKYIIKSNGKEGKVKTIKRTKNVQVISGDNDDVIEILINEDNDNIQNVKKVIVKGENVDVIEENANIVVKGKKKSVWVSDDGNEEDVIILKSGNDDKNIFISGNNKDPLIIVDGKEISKAKMKDIKPDMLKSMRVLKGKKAIDKYGAKGKDGVIEITLKKKN